MPNMAASKQKEAAAATLMLRKVFFFMFISPKARSELKGEGRGLMQMPSSSTPTAAAGSASPPDGPVLTAHRRVEPGADPTRDSRAARLPPLRRGRTAQAHEPSSRNR